MAYGRLHSPILRSVSLGNTHNIQGGQNYFEPIRTKIRTFSEEIRTIRTIFEKQSVQSVQFF